MTGLIAMAIVSSAPLHAALPGGIAQSQSQPPRPAAFADSVARRLHARAIHAWAGVEESLSSYTARIEQRSAAAVRLGMKDRILYRNETALRVLWRRDGPPVTEVLGTRSRWPGGGSIAGTMGYFGWLRRMPFEEPFDPAGDRLLFGLAREDVEGGRFKVGDRTELRDLGVIGPSNDFWFAHPLTENAGEGYRFRSGDTLTLTLQDGSRLRAVELDVLPREADPHLISGTLWIEPESGALVRAVYSLARPMDMLRDMGELGPNEVGPPPIPPMLRPLLLDIDYVSVSYSHWEGGIWLPQAMRLEATISVGTLRAPVAFEMAYRIEEATASADEAAEAAEAFLARALASEDGVEREVRERPPRASPRGTLVVPVDGTVVERSPDLPPPIWDEAAGFPSRDEVDTFLSTLAGLPQPPPALATGRWTLEWPWTHEGLLRYNRVEGLSVGGQAEAALGRRFRLTATGRIGLAGFRPGARLELERSTVWRRLSLAAYHELAATELRGNHLGVGNSARAFFLGRDHGDYYQTTGAELAWRPPLGAPQSFAVRVYGERQGSVEREAGFALFRIASDDWSFRPNPAADEIEEAGAELRLAPWWGTGTGSAQFGMELYLQGAAWRGDAGEGESGAATPLAESRSTEAARRRYLRGSAELRMALPLSGAHGTTLWRLGAEAGAGTTRGDAPAQRSWLLGGPGTLRGFDPAAIAGTSFARGRVELAWVARELGLSLFGDAGWAGERTAFDADDLLYGTGVGATIIDGLVRIDLARALNGRDPGFRLHLHLNSVL